MADAVKRLLILSVSVGAGHVRAAQAVEAAAKSRGMHVEHVDVMTLVSKAFQLAYRDIYIDLVERLPQLWAHLYHKLDQTEDDAVLTKMRRAFERVNTSALREVVTQARADAIVCTHFLPAELLARGALRGHAVPPTWVVVTDFDVHRLWLPPSLVESGVVRGFFVASDEVAFRVREALPSMPTHVTGIPVMPAFATAPPRADAARELGIRADRLTALVMTGGAGLSSGAAMVERLLTVDGDFQIIAIAGKSADLLERYRALAEQHPGRLFPMGFTTTIERVMAACDVAITKPGGLSTSECLAVGLPMVLIAPIPGQEERNAHHLLEQGAAWLAPDASALEWRWRLLLGNAQLLDALRTRARAMGRPHAADAVVRRIVDDA